MKRLFLALAFSVLVSGCATMDNILSDESEDGVDSMPWNTPAGWEDEVIGLPY